MTTTMAEQTTGTRSPTEGEIRMTRGRKIVIAMLAVSLLLSFLLRAGVHSLHDKLVYSDRPRPANRLQGLNSFALGLILGGLRGPLVMFLWTSTEQQKTQRDLEDLDTKIDLIRMLQPEFDSVHIFQAWNKAYNVSAQIATLPNKYATVLDGIRYVKDVEAERPDNINALVSLADIYFNKLGNSAEKKYYVSRIREDSKFREQKASRLAGQRLLRHDPLLTPEGFIQPRLLEGSSRLGADKKTADGLEYTGAELQFLAKYNTPEAGGFPYGVSPVAIGYNYYERATILQEVTKRRHLYLTESVVDSRAPIALKIWADEEWDRAMRAEAKLVGKTIPDEKKDQPPVTASLKASELTNKSDAMRATVVEGLFSYDRGALVATDAAARHRRHMQNSTYLNADYRSHAEEADAQAALHRADHAYLSAVAAQAQFTPPVGSADRAPEFLRTAKQHYQDAVRRYYLHVLKYYTEDDVAAAVYKKVTGLDLDKTTIQRADPSLYEAVFNETRRVLKEQNRQDFHGEDNREYEAFIDRCKVRLALIDAALGTSPDAAR